MRCVAPLLICLCCDESGPEAGALESDSNRLPSGACPAVVLGLLSPWGLGLGEIVVGLPGAGIGGKVQTEQGVQQCPRHGVLCLEMPATIPSKASAFWLSGFPLATPDTDFSSWAWDSFCP